MSEAYAWFKFNAASWMMGRVQRLSFAHQGAFIRLCCVYWTKWGEVSKEDAELECSEEYFNDLLKLKIVKLSDTGISIDFLDEQLDKAKVQSETNSNNARQRTANKSLTNGKRTANEPLAERKKEREREERKCPSLELVLKFFDDNGYTESHAKAVFEYYDGLDWHDKNGQDILSKWRFQCRQNWFKPEGLKPLTQEEKSKVMNNPPVSESDWNRLTRNEQHNYNVMHGGSNFPLKQK